MSPRRGRRSRAPDLSVLRGQRVLITGAARGIGAELAQSLAAQGARLALVGLEAQWLDAVGARCGPDTFIGECDVSNLAQVAAAVDAAASDLGGLDVVVANAGIAAGGPLEMTDMGLWSRVIDVNLIGVAYTDRAAIPHLTQTGGYLLNIASGAAIFRSPGLSAYSAAKAGVEAMSDCLRMELAPHRVGVGVAYFLYLDTDMVRDAEREMEGMREGRERLPKFLGRTYPLVPAVDALVAGIAGRRRRIAYPGWLTKALVVRQLLASALMERLVSEGSSEMLADYSQLVSARGSRAASATERTRALAGE